MSIIDRYAFEKIFKVRPGYEKPSMLRDNEIDALIALIKSFNCKTVAEFGVNHGHTASVILRACPNIVKYIGVDICENTTIHPEQANEVPSPEQVAYMAKHDPRFNLLLRKNGTFDLTSNDFSEVDFVFIDGDHSETAVRYDTLLARSLNPKVIAWHDYGDSPGSWCHGPTNVINELNTPHDNHVNLIDGTTLCFEIFPTLPTPKFAVVTVCTDEWTELRDLVKPSFFRYCEQFGYTAKYHSASLDSSKSVKYSKIPAILELLDDHDYVLWVDADTIFTRPIALNAFVNRNPEADLFISNDINGPNSGVFMLKNTKKSKIFLEDVLKLEPTFPTGWADNAAIHHLISNNCDLKIEYLPQKEFNQYLGGQTFIIHAAGFDLPEKIELLRKYA